MDILDKVKEIIQEYKEEQEALPPINHTEAVEEEQILRLRIEKRLAELLEERTKQQEWLVEEGYFDDELNYIKTGRMINPSLTMRTRTKGIFKQILQEFREELGGQPEPEE